MTQDLPHTIASRGDTGRLTAVPLVIAIVLGMLAAVLLAVPTTGTRVAGLVIAVITGFLVWVWRRNKRITDRLEPGVIDVPSTVFFLGSRVPARFRRLVKQGTTDTVDLTARLVLKEWVRYRQGTDTRTASEEIQSIPVEVVRAWDGRHVIGEMLLEIPAFPPSFAATDNTVSWELHVDMTFADGFTEDSVIPLWVVPAAQRSDLQRLGLM
ncbi:hypothetical protein [Euzebya rosea]|uniref:hypothetical protein n=1 Tax=Euzebya rosea TaxID=2052804 RepID=UPI000D3E5B5E|nr:hypothetical protein [Euzebya rosea]